MKKWHTLKPLQSDEHRHKHRHINATSIAKCTFRLNVLSQTKQKQRKQQHNH